VSCFGHVSGTLEQAEDGFAEDVGVLRDLDAFSDALGTAPFVDLQVVSRRRVVRVLLLQALRGLRK